MRRVLLMLLPLVALLSVGDAFAARLGRVAVDNAAVINKPGPGAKIVARLPKGTVIATADQPSAGYYRMKSKTGVSGYISVRSVAFGAAASSQSGSEGESAEVRRNRRRQELEPPEKSGGLMVRGFGGLNLFNSTSAVAALNTVAGLSNGIGLGLELGLGFSSSLTGLLRLESLSRAVRATVPDSGTMTATDSAYSISVGSMPIMVGAALSLVDDDSLAIDFAMLAGMGLGTKLTAEATGDTTTFPVPNINTFSKSAITFMGKFDIMLKLGKSIGLYTEVGYRMLKASNAPRTLAGSGDGLFRDSNGAGNLLSVSPSLSGPVLGLGVQIKL